jgi:hypothetical protein
MPIDPTEEDIGKEVAYRASHEGARLERGWITQVTDEYVFVSYRGKSYGVATRREDLQWGWGEPDG